uniref:Uncharacterized protein n=1 Tax=Solanum tuberosum TaxID=4113 RepID=M1DTZ3_SOLTU
MKRLRTADEEKEEISIYMRIAKTIKLNVNESNSVGDFKAFLHDKEDLPSFKRMHSVRSYNGVAKLCGELLYLVVVMVVLLELEACGTIQLYHID